MNVISRRGALGSMAGVVAGVRALRADELSDFIAADERSTQTSFFFVTDTHYLADKQKPAAMDSRSATICRRLVQALNSLEGQPIPGHAGGGRVGEISGVIHGGDVVDSGDKRGNVYSRMQETEFDAFERDFGLNGTEGHLNYPVREVYGNHDGPQGDTLVVDRIMKRNQSRSELIEVSPNGLHYSWVWGKTHFINLGIVVGQSRAGLQPRRYNPRESLQFLRADLKKMGDRNRPVIVTQHVDLARYSRPYKEDQAEYLTMEWHPQDVQAFHQAVAPFNVIANFFGHTHRRDVYGWNGTPERQPFTRADMDAFNGDNSSHFGGGKQAFFYAEISDTHLVVREVKTEDGWLTNTWGETVWAKRL